MKSHKKLLFLFCLALPILANAQNDIYKTLAKETCSCITKKDLSTATKSSIETTLGLCMLESIQNNNIEVDISDSKAMRSFGEKVGIQMAPICPEVFTFLTQENGDDDISETFKVSGKIKDISENEFLFITVKEESGKQTRLIWLRYFKGSDEYLSNPNDLIGKNVTVSYQPVECYLPAAKGYFAYKEIVEMELE